jgi:hypothetical protein
MGSFAQLIADIFSIYLYFTYQRKPFIYKYISKVKFSRRIHADCNKKFEAELFQTSWSDLNENDEVNVLHD